MPEVDLPAVRERYREYERQLCSGEATVRPYALASAADLVLRHVPALLDRVEELEARVGRHRSEVSGE